MVASRCSQSARLETYWPPESSWMRGAGDAPNPAEQVAGGAHVGTGLLPGRAGGSDPLCPANAKTWKLANSVTASAMTSVAAVGIACEPVHRNDLRRPGRSRRVERPATTSTTSLSDRTRGQSGAPGRCDRGRGQVDHQGDAQVRVPSVSWRAGVRVRIVAIEAPPWLSDTTP